MDTKADPLSRQSRQVNGPLKMQWMKSLERTWSFKVLYETYVPNAVSAYQI